MVTIARKIVVGFRNLNNKKIGEIHSSSISESTLHCALKLGGGCGLINASKSDSYSLLEYLKQNQNKQINKQGENNVTK